MNESAVPHTGATISPATSSNRYAWMMVVVAALAMVATLPGRTHGLGMITERLLNDPVLQLDRISYSRINLWGTLLGGLFCLPCGWMIDRFGLRISLTFTVAALAATVLWMTRLTSPIQFSAAIVLTRGFGQSALSVISITMVGKWFTGRLSLSMAVYSLLLSLGFAYAAQLAKPWADADWRLVWSGMGYLLVLFAVVCAFAVRDPQRSAERKSKTTIGSANSDPDRAVSDNTEMASCCSTGIDPIKTMSVENSMTTAAALRTQAFWVFALSISLVGLMSSGLSLFNESVLTAQGFPKDVFYNLITLTGTVGLLAKLPVGWLGQRCRLNRMLTVGLMLQAVCMFALPSIRSTIGITLYGAAMGVSGTITTVLFFTVWGQVFGQKHLGQIQSLAQMLTVVFSAVGPLVFGKCFANFCSYQPAFWGISAVSIAFAIWSWLIALPETEGEASRDLSSTTRSVFNYQSVPQES
ncbi:MAG: MFS transporter [Planctomycetaceae bacterium]